ncbi:MFS transporter [Paenibacillus albidus]|uniref:MFS transporter n=1 Tax=Paenibacillus albidus TaxID=2041023 RepID=A0A917C3R7_9BACL|nr:MFS transporter [Paenibacillus albidus]GGF70804.1 MFS transporter [Paenibacillus albidus]
MATLFLIIIYLAFISLGLPDSLLGVAWPLIRPELGAPLAAAGYLSMTVAGGTIVSSLASGFVIHRFGTGKVTLVSCMLTACALLGFSFSTSVLWLALLAVPLGLGAGAVDAGLNNYVASHYKAHHMSWLHCFWGIGATLGPIIMSRYILSEHSWRSGYLAVAWIQFALVALLFLTLPLWKRTGHEAAGSPGPAAAEQPVQEAGDGSRHFVKSGVVKPLQIKGVKLTLLTFLLYCGVETTMGLWGSSFLVNVKGVDVAVAAQWVSLYFSGITAGRLITGFITLKVKSRILIRAGQLTALTGAVLLLLPLPLYCSLAGFILVGLGCAPIFPCLLHETPARFGKDHSQRIMGYQMAMAYTGTTLLPPLLGLMATRTPLGMGIFPYLVTLYAVAMMFSSEKINSLLKTRFAGDR